MELTHDRGGARTICAHLKHTGPAMDGAPCIPYPRPMAVPQALLEQLMKLDDQERLEVAQLLLSTVDDEDDLADDERGRLHAALERSLADIKTGRVHDAGDVIAELRARHLP